MTKTKLIIREPDVEEVNRIELVDYHDGRAEIHLDVGEDGSYSRQTYRCSIEDGAVSVMTKEVDDEWETATSDDIKDGVGAEIESVEYELEE